MLLHFHFKDTSLKISKRKRLRSFIFDIFKREGVLVQSVDYIFCTDEYLLSINQTFLKHDYYTDIVTFNFSGNNEPVIGEIYISVERIKENAKEFKTSLNQEIHRVMFHGVLHLCGYKDKSKVQRLLMRSLEDKYLHLYFA